MKKILVTTIVFFIVNMAGGPLPPAFALETQKEITVLFDGIPVDFDAAPYLRGGRVLVPFRALAETMDLKVDWDNGTRTVTASGNGILVSLRIGSLTAYCNGKAVTLDAAPEINAGRTMVPLRFIGESLGCRVAWAGEKAQVSITSPLKKVAVTAYYALGDKTTSSWTGLFRKEYPATGTGNTDMVSELALGWYSLDREGNLLTKSRTGWQRPEGWESVLASARKYSIKTTMVVHVTDHDHTITDFLGSETARTRAVESIAREAALYGGVNLDFEGLGWSYDVNATEAVKNSFTAFVRQLSSRLRETGATLSLALHPPNSAYRGYDYRALGEAADSIIIMAYDYGSRPEPYGMVKEAVIRSLAEVPPGKLMLGISAPGETASSITTKLGLAKRYSLKGIALWRLGLIPADMWVSIRESIEAEK